jgi:hypothetical protein
MSPGWKFAAHAASLEVTIQLATTGFDLHRVGLVSLLFQRLPQKTTLGFSIVL